MRAHRTRLDRVPIQARTPYVDDVLPAISASAIGHALAAKVHTADRWIASCAIAKSIPILSGDTLLDDAPDLTPLDLPAR